MIWQWPGAGQIPAATNQVLCCPEVWFILILYLGRMTNADSGRKELWFKSDILERKKWSDLIRLLQGDERKLADMDLQKAVARTAVPKAYFYNIVNRRYDEVFFMAGLLHLSKYKVTMAGRSEESVGDGKWLPDIRNRILFCYERKSMVCLVCLLWDRMQLASRGKWRRFDSGNRNRSVKLRIYYVCNVPGADTPCRCISWWGAFPFATKSESWRIKITMMFTGGHYGRAAEASRAKSKYEAPNASRRIQYKPSGKTVPITLGDLASISCLTSSVWVMQNQYLIYQNMGGDVLFIPESVSGRAHPRPFLMESGRYYDGSCHGDRQHYRNLKACMMKITETQKNKEKSDEAALPSICRNENTDYWQEKK